jgi:hypothetical protein
MSRRRYGCGRGPAPDILTLIGAVVVIVCAGGVVSALLLVVAGVVLVVGLVALAVFLWRFESWYYRKPPGS